MSGQPGPQSNILVNVQYMQIDEVVCRHHGPSPLDPVREPCFDTAATGIAATMSEISLFSPWINFRVPVSYYQVRGALCVALQTTSFISTYVVIHRLNAD
jgi:hypothetical protein